MRVSPLFVAVTCFFGVQKYTSSPVGLIRVKDTHVENTPSNKTQALTKSIYMDTWIIATLNQPFIWGSYTQVKFPKK